MKKYTVEIELEVDSNVTEENIQHAIEEMSDSLSGIRQCFYNINEWEAKRGENCGKRFEAVSIKNSTCEGFWVVDRVNDTYISVPDAVNEEALRRFVQHGIESAVSYIEDMANNERPGWLDNEANTFAFDEIEL